MGQNREKQRDTKQRRIVREAVMGRCDHPTAEDLYQDVVAVDSRISKGTVYRNLRILADNGEILQVRVPGADRFDLHAKNHYHAICTSCGRVVDVCAPYNDGIDERTSAETGFAITGHQLIFEGLCPKCRTNAE